MNLTLLDQVDCFGKRVLVRADLDFDPQDLNNARLKSLIPTLDYLKEKQANIILLGHRGRPDGRINPDLSLSGFQPYFDKWGAKVEENLRFDPSEESNNFDFAKKLAALGDVYVNEAFASSHREHASIVSLPKLLPHAAGLHFVKEVENLSKVLNSPARPLLILMSGIKEDKLTYAYELSKIADKILIAGRLPDFIEMNDVYSQKFNGNEKFQLARLLPDKEDITIHSIENFEEEIKKAGTIVLSGPIGKYEDGGHLMGTKRIFEAISLSFAQKIAGGGDTESAISKLSLTDKFDWISTGGGAMLELLTKGTLPGIEAIKTVI